MLPVTYTNYREQLGENILAVGEYLNADIRQLIFLYYLSNNLNY